MKTRHRAKLPEHRPRDIDQLAAIVRFRAWDAEMIQRHGPLYYRRMGYSLH